MAAVLAGTRVVAGSAIGIAFGSAVFVTGGFAQLAHAWGDSFGWNQSQLASAVTVYLLMQVAALPLVGWLLDRWGTRWVASASVALFALALFALGQVGPALWQLYLCFAAIGLAGAGTNSVSYARALSLWFDRRRGLALGLATSSQAIGAVLIPTLGAKIISASGWSSAVVSLAMFELLVCLPMVALLVRDKPAGQRAGANRSTVANAAPAVSAKSALMRSSIFWKLAVSFAVMGLTAYALSANVVFILTQTAGLSPLQIGKLQAVSGAAVLLGRLGFGMLLDRARAPLVCLLAVGASALGIAIFAGGQANLMALVVAGALLGASVGGETDLMPYLASRYFGAAALSTSLGWLLAAFFLGAALGPPAFAAIAAAQQSVVIPLHVLLALQLVPIALLATLGRYPDLPAREAT